MFGKKEKQIPNINLPEDNIINSPMEENNEDNETIDTNIETKEEELDKKELKDFTFVVSSEILSDGTFKYVIISDKYLKLGIN